MTMRARVAAILLVLATGACSGAKHSVPKSPHNEQFTTLKGMTVENNDGDKLGKLVNLALDLQTGAPEFAIVRTSGVGWFARERAVPASYFAFASIKSGTLSLDVNGNRWARAPMVDAGSIERLNQPSHRREILSYFKKDSARPQNSGMPALAPTGRGRDDSHEPGPMALATDIIGNTVLDPRQNRIGKVSDLLIAPEGRKKTMIIFSAGSFLKRGPRYAIPFDAVSIDEKNDAVVLKHPVDLSQATPFAWTNATSDNVFIYH